MFGCGKVMFGCGKTMVSFQLGCGKMMVSFDAGELIERKLNYFQENQCLRQGLGGPLHHLAGKNFHIKINIFHLLKIVTTFCGRKINSGLGVGRSFSPAHHGPPQARQIQTFPPSARA